MVLIILILLAIISFGTVFVISQLDKKNQQPKLPGEKERTIDLKSAYKNPFAQSQQEEYVNPFEEYENPFDQLK